MNEFERKKALYQVLSRVKAFYLNLHLLSEWSKFSSTHLLIKVYSDSFWIFPHFFRHS
jgi:hypothetical protein